MDGFSDVYGAVANLNAASDPRQDRQVSDKKRRL